MRRELRADLERYRDAGSSWREIFSNPVVWALVWFRFGHWVYREGPTGLIRIPLKIIYRIGAKWFEVTMEMCISAAANIGHGLYMTHIGGIHVHPDVIIGENCNLAHQVTIGASAMGRKGVPKIGNNVYIGTGAVIIGKIRIGDGAKIAANTLVMTNVPEGATLMGVPGRVVALPSATSIPAAVQPLAIETQTEIITVPE